MNTKLSPALMSEEDDLKEAQSAPRGVRGWLDSLMAPPRRAHRYAGILTIAGQSLVFRGTDLRKRTDFQQTIPLGKISSVSLGLNEEHRGGRDRSGAREPEPLVVRHERNGRTVTEYFATNFPGLTRRVDGNRYWYEALRDGIRQCRAPQVERAYATVRAMDTGGLQLR